MNVSDYIVQFLKTSGVETVFELSGGMIMHLLDAIQQEGSIQIVNVYHEQAAAFAADAVGRLSGRPGVAIGTSGPGAINLLTGLGSSFFDSSPAVFITGQVNRHEQKGLRGIRQLGFQETDIVSMAQPITKWAARITDPAQIPGYLRKAFSVATEGRPGAVLLDIPMDIFRSSIERTDLPEQEIPRQLPENLREGIKSLQAALSGSRSPLILAGGGIRASGTASEFRKFVERTQLPVVNSLMACDCLPHNHPFRVGMIGTYGNRWANLAISKCDLLLVLGSRLDIRQTGADTDSFSSGRNIFHVDVEHAEINNRVTTCVPIHSDLRHFFEAVESGCRAIDTSDWLQTINTLREEWPDISELRGITGINPNEFMHELSRNRVVGAWCVDVGLHQMWAAQSLELDEAARFLTSGGLGAMGFSLPAAVGAAFHFHRERPVVVIAGDAGFQLNIQELQTVAHHQLPVKIVVMNNHCHGMTRQFQDTYFAARYPGTVWGYSTPAFHKVAEAYGIAARNITTVDEIPAAIEWFWRDAMQPCLLEVQIDQKTNAYPKLAFGRAISEMEPFAVPLQMEST